MKKILWGIALVVAAFIVWTFLLFAMAFVEANAADHAVVSFNGYELYADTVSFNSPTDLIAKTRAVVGVCDTSRWQDPPAHGEDYPYQRITCRELVGVTVTRERGIREIKCYDKWGQYSHTEATMKPGQAIIFYDPVEVRQ